MNLLNVLLQSMTTDDSVEALTKRSGASSSALGNLIPLALPLLLQGLTNNASNAGGASSLLSALGQHTSTAPMASQIQNADLSDGSAILSHIFGGNLGNVTGQLSQQTGLTDQQVSSALSSMAPGILSGLSAATQQAQQQPQNSIDLSDLMQLFGGGQPVQQQQSSGIGSLFGSLLGGGQQQQQQQPSVLGSLLGSLFGAKPQQQQTSGFDGSGLLSALLSAMK